MGWKNKTDFKAYRDRRSQRGQQRAEELRDRVVGILTNMQDQNRIQEFVEVPNPAIFVVVGMVENMPTPRKFGVSISPTHPKENTDSVIYFHIPPETKTETIEKKIIDLFKN